MKWSLYIKSSNSGDDCPPNETDKNTRLVGLFFLSKFLLFSLYFPLRDMPFVVAVVALFS